ncbi:MAG: hypothetical protein JXB49_31635 [Bacteroidales bacterium]|nr:hypothetical protein [Bacteroidales bacterium]
MKTTKTKCIILLFFTGIICLQAQGSRSEVEKYFSDHLGVDNYFVTTDNFDNIYVSGFFMDTLTIKNYFLQTRGLLDIFIAKFDNNGKLIWVKQAGGFDVDMCQNIYTDIYNNVYVSGAFKGAAHFEDTVLYSQRTYNYFTAKYSNAGDLVWVKTNN